MQLQQQQHQQQLQQQANDLINNSIAPPALPARQRKKATAKKSMQQQQQQLQNAHGLLPKANPRLNSIVPGSIPSATPGMDDSMMSLLNPDDKKAMLGGNLDNDLAVLTAELEIGKVFLTLQKIYLWVKI